MEVLGGVLILGRIAAADVAALLADAQMHPRIAEGYALWARIFGSGFEAGEGREVLAGFGSGHDEGRFG